jgi:hypothetical protein
MAIAPDTALNTARLALRRVDFCDIDLAWQASRNIDDGNHWAVASILQKN